MFTLEGIDHVALTARDVGRAVAWSRGCWGWNGSTKTPGGLPRGRRRGHDEPGTVLLPCRRVRPAPDNATIAMRHVAFRVDRRDIAFDLNDHTIAHSIYFHDPDSHRIEITTYGLSNE